MDLYRAVVLPGLLMAVRSGHLLATWGLVVTCIVLNVCAELWSVPEGTDCPTSLIWEYPLQLCGHVGHIPECVADYKVSLPGISKGLTLCGGGHGIGFNTCGWNKQWFMLRRTGDGKGVCVEARLKGSQEMLTTPEHGDILTGVCDEWVKWFKGMILSLLPSRVVH